LDLGLNATKRDDDGKERGGEAAHDWNPLVCRADEGQR
jgi:hypothetical protein